MTALLTRARVAETPCSCGDMGGMTHRVFSPAPRYRKDTADKMPPNSAIVEL